MNAKRILRIGVLLIIAYIVIRVIFGVVSALAHLVVVAGIIFVIYYVVTNLMGRGGPRRY
jgi:hypothetical protein